MKKLPLIFQTTLCLLFLNQSLFCPPKRTLNCSPRTTRSRQGVPVSYLPTATPITPGTTSQSSVAELLLGGTPVFWPSRRSRRAKQPDPRPTLHRKGIYSSQEPGCHCQDTCHSDCRMAIEDDIFDCLIGLAINPRDTEKIQIQEQLCFLIEALKNGIITTTKSESFSTKYCDFIKEKLPQVITLTKEAIENIKKELGVSDLNDLETILTSLRSILRFYFKYLNGDQIADIPDYLINPEVMLFLRASIENQTTLKFKFLCCGVSYKTDCQQDQNSNPIENQTLQSTVLTIDLTA